jgi:hypothetical protein
MELVSHTRLQSSASQPLSRQENHYNILKSKTSAPTSKRFQISTADTESVLDKVPLKEITMPCLHVSSDLQTLQISTCATNKIQEM